METGSEYSDNCAIVRPYKCYFRDCTSYHDTEKNIQETSYQWLMLGSLAGLKDTHEVDQIGSREMVDMI